VGGGAAGSASSTATEMREQAAAPSSICVGNQLPVVDGQGVGADLQHGRQLVAAAGEEAAGLAAKQAAAPAAMPGCCAAFRGRRVRVPIPNRRPLICWLLGYQADGLAVGPTSAKAYRPAGPSAATACQLVGQAAAPGWTVAPERPAEPGDGNMGRLAILLG
jgi:hypothetical protein